MNGGDVNEFTLSEARDVLSVLRALAPDGLLAPLSQSDVHAVLEVGAEVKSISLGLLDFPTTILGVPAYWCWQSGENELAWWHPQSTGFSGRRRVDDLPDELRGHT